MRIQSLTRTEKSLVAIARALAADAEVLVLDEPTASLPADEVVRLFTALRRLRDRGVGMIYVSHRLDEVFEIADRMVVLRDGRVAGERVVKETTPDETILLIVGREPSQIFRRPAERQGAPRLELDSLLIDAVGPVDCRLHAGEIVAYVGLRGAGQEAIGRALFGVVPTTGGRIVLDGRAISARDPREAMAFGLNLVCADRVGKSIMPNLTVRENLFLNPVAADGACSRCWAAARLPRGAQAGRRGRVAAERSRSRDRTALGRQSAEGRRRAMAASGGQTLRLRRSDRRHRRRREGGDATACSTSRWQAGAAILIVSTDFEEVAKVWDRALVFDRGRVVAELFRSRSVPRKPARGGFGECSQDGDGERGDGWLDAGRRGSIELQRASSRRARNWRA